MEHERLAIAQASNGGTARLQLSRLNMAWRFAVETVPAYRALADSLNCKNGFCSIGEFAAKIPILEKSALASGAASAKTYDIVRRSGGSTGTPTHFPTWRQEHSIERVSSALARAQHGIALTDRLALIWGHAHLLGDGWRGRWNSAVRLLKDQALGYTRISAYDLSPTALDCIADQLAHSRADCLLGYAHALDTLARRLLERGVRPVGSFKAVIATAEALPFNDSVECIETAFGAPLLLEYGAVETGPIAYARANKPYEAIWSRFLLEAEEPKEPVSDLLVTALYPRATPLFRYRIGDRVDLTNARTSVEGGLLGFTEIRGRSNQRIVLPSGKSLHSEVASHLFRTTPSVRRYQIAYGGGIVIARYASDVSLKNEQIDQLRRIARRIDPELGAVLQFKQVSESGLLQAASGKFPTVVMLPVEGAPSAR